MALLMTNDTWLVPFKGRNPSGPQTQNFLWRTDALYVMDNHPGRAVVLGCSTCAVGSNMRLLHIDQHFDALSSRLDQWLAALPDLWSLSLENYLSITSGPAFERLEVLRYDNYLSILLARHPELVQEAIFVTHGQCDKPRLRKAAHVLPWHVQGNLCDWLTRSGPRWIVNLDLDYFVADVDEATEQLVSDAFVRSVACAIEKARDAGMVEVVTIALSPDNTGGWDIATRLWNLMREEVGTTLTVPE